MLPKLTDHIKSYLLAVVPQAKWSEIRKNGKIHELFGYKYRKQSDIDNIGWVDSK